MITCAKSSGMFSGGVVQITLSAGPIGPAVTIVVLATVGNLTPTTHLTARAGPQRERQQRHVEHRPASSRPGLRHAQAVLLAGNRARCVHVTAAAFHPLPRRALAYA